MYNTWVTIQIFMPSLNVKWIRNTQDKLWKCEMSLTLYPFWNVQGFYILAVRLYLLNSLAGLFSILNFIMHQYTFISLCARWFIRFIII